ncbi:MAG: cupin-like domain-containing protein [Flavobacteriales bacterium]|nr:cupin-like domain-containing protein [Flavobacteriales bacterium]
MVEGHQMNSESPNILRIPCPDNRTFFKDFVNPGIPVILTDLQNGWKARELWDTAYLRMICGDSRVGTMRLTDGLCDVDTYSERPEHRMALSEVLDAVDAGVLDGGRVIASPTDSFGSRLIDDYSVPTYCEGKRFFRSRIYVGPKGTVTSLHQDLPENLYTLVHGRKRIALFHPNDSGHLYRNPFWHRHPNFSQVDPEWPDSARFPKFNQTTPITVDLAAGETLYIPALWWHHLRNLELSIAMSFWWPEGWRLPIAWAAARYKALTSTNV